MPADTGVLAAVGAELRKIPGLTVYVEGERAGLAAALDALAAEVSVANWDGHGAPPVTRAALDAARAVLAALPADLPDPSLGAEADGCVTLEWYAAPDCLLSASVGCESWLWWAGSFGPLWRPSGSHKFAGEFPPELAELARRVVTKGLQKAS